MTDWTDTPPTEAGWYWWRESAQAPQSFCTEIDDEGDAWITADFWQEASTFGGQWWPVPIPRPGEGTDWRAVATDMRTMLDDAIECCGEDWTNDNPDAQSFYDAAVARHTKGGE